MRILLTGAAGQVGRALQECAPAGVDLMPLDRNHLDLADAKAIFEQVRGIAPQIIINAAAYTQVDLAEDEPDQATRLNAEAVKHLVESAGEVGAKVVHISTDFVFDGEGGRPYTSADIPRPKSVYGGSKLDGEKALRETDLLVRTAWVYDSSGRNFVTTMLRLFRERDTVSVVSDQIGTPTSASDLARALWHLIDLDAAGVLHFTNSGVASWYDFAIAIAEEAKMQGLLDRDVEILPIPSSAYPTKAVRPHNSVLDCNEAYRLLGAHAPHWRRALRAVLKDSK